MYSVTGREGPSGEAIVTLDDGNLNTFDHAVFQALCDALDESRDAPAVVFTGRSDVFSAGLNLKAVSSLSRNDLRDMLLLFGRTMMKVWLEPRPVVVAATGHAIAAGTMLSLAADHTVAARGAYRWGLTETRIGFGLPIFGMTLARANMRADRYDDLLLRGEVVGPEEAVEAGFADELAAPEIVLETALKRADELRELPLATYALQKGRLRGDAARHVLETLEGDIESLLPPAR